MTDTDKALQELVEDQDAKRMLSLLAITEVVGTLMIMLVEKKLFTSDELSGAMRLMQEELNPSEQDSAERLLGKEYCRDVLSRIQERLHNTSRPAVRH